MSEAGEVLHADVLHRPDGKSKGAGLVRFATAEAAEKAIKELTNTALMGRQIFVREDREAGKQKTSYNKRTTSNTQSQSTSGGTSKPGQVSVFVGNIPWHTGWETIKDLFGKYGVQHVDVGELRNGRSRGWAIVKFEDKANASAAIKALNGYNLDGRTIEVRFDNKN
eukprot:1100171-Amorphochlora_amoeboformis.AAC.1